MFVDIIKVFNL